MTNNDAGSSSGSEQLRYKQYDSAEESTYLPLIRALITKDLSEPYSIYVYRYFLYQWGDLCFMVSHGLHIDRRVLTDSGA